MSETVPVLTSLAMHRSLQLRRGAIALLVILVALALHWLLFQSREVASGVIARPFGTCDIEWFDKRGGAVVIAGPHTDSIKLWPFPVEQPWFEDPLVPLLTAEIN